MATPAPAEEWFLIMQGVHRSVGAREAGLSGILAQVEIYGKKVGLKLIALDRIVSPKATIGRWDRGRDFMGLVALMQTVEGRGGIKPIFVEPVSATRAARFTRLTEVLVLDDIEEDWQ